MSTRGSLLTVSNRLLAQSQNTSTLGKAGLNSSSALLQNRSDAMQRNKRLKPFSTDSKGVNSTTAREKVPSNTSRHQQSSTSSVWLGSSHRSISQKPSEVLINKVESIGKKPEELSPTMSDLLYLSGSSTSGLFWQHHKSFIDANESSESRNLNIGGVVSARDNSLLPRRSKVDGLNNPKSYSPLPKLSTRVNELVNKVELDSCMWFNFCHTVFNCCITISKLALAGR